MNKRSQVCHKRAHTHMSGFISRMVEEVGWLAVILTEPYDSFNIAITCKSAWNSPFYSPTGQGMELLVLCSIPCGTGDGMGR